MRIGLVVDRLVPGGKERVVCHLARNFRMLGATVRVCCMRDSGEFGKQLVDEGISVCSIESTGRMDISGLLRLATWIDTGKLDVINVHDRASLKYVHAAKTISHRSPVVFTAHGLLHSTKSLGRIERFLARDVQAVTAVSPSVGEAYRQLFGWQIPVDVIRNGITPVKWDPRLRDLFRKELGIADETTVILAVGNIKPEKGYIELLDATEKLFSEVEEDFVVAVAGRIDDSNYARLLEEKLEARGLAERFRLLGMRSDLQAVLSGADLYVLPSLTEGLPMALLEAMSAGLACVASDVGDIADVLGSGRYGKIVPAGNAKILAHVLRELVEKPEKRKCLGKLAAERVRAQYSASSMAKQYMALFRKIMPISGERPSEEARPGVVMLGPRYPLTGGMATVTNLLCESRLADLCDLRVIHNAKTTREGRSFLAGVGAQVSLVGRIIKSLSSGQDKITHIHTCSGFTFFRDCLHALVARGLGSRVVWHVHGGRFKQFLDKLPWAGRRIARLMLTRADAVIVLSNQWIRTLEGFAPGARWRAVPNGVAVPEEPTKVEANRCLLFLGNLGRPKGASDLVEALIRARQKCSEVCGKLAGNETATGEMSKLSQRIRQSPQPEAVELIGIVKGRDKLERLEQAGFFCLPSYAEGLPMAMLEAMAAGLGVIVTRVGAIPEVITDGVEGFLVDPGDVETLSDRIVRLSEDGQLRKTMGAAARRKVIQHYSLDRMAERIYGLYEEVTRRR